MMQVYPVRVPPQTRAGLDIAARRHGIPTPEYVRMCLQLISEQRINLKLEIKPSERPPTAPEPA